MQIQATTTEEYQAALKKLVDWSATRETNTAITGRLFAVSATWEEMHQNWLKPSPQLVKEISAHIGASLDEDVLWGGYPASYWLSGEATPTRKNDRYQHIINGITKPLPVIDPRPNHDYDPVWTWE